MAVEVDPSQIEGKLSLEGLEVELYPPYVVLHCVGVGYLLPHLDLDFNHLPRRHLLGCCYYGDVFLALPIRGLDPTT